MGKGQVSFTCPPALQAKLQAETNSRGFVKHAETVRAILDEYFARKGVFEEKKAR